MNTLHFLFLIESFLAEYRISFNFEQNCIRLIRIKGFSPPVFNLHYLMHWCLFSNPAWSLTSWLSKIYFQVMCTWPCVDSLLTANRKTPTTNGFPIDKFLEHKSEPVMIIWWLKYLIKKPWWKSTLFKKLRVIFFLDMENKLSWLILGAVFTIFGYYSNYLSKNILKKAVIIFI